MKRIIGLVSAAIGILGIISRPLISIASYMVMKNLISDRIGKIIIGFETAESKLIFIGWILFIFGLILLGRKLGRVVLYILGISGIIIAILPFVDSIFSLFLNFDNMNILLEIEKHYLDFSLQCIFFSSIFLIVAWLILRPKYYCANCGKYLGHKINDCSNCGSSLYITKKKYDTNIIYFK